MRKRIDILPGGMLSDVVPNALGTSQHQLVKNLRQVRVGEWEVVKPHVKIDAMNTPTIKCAVEVDDDQSGDRFILYQDGNSLKRIDWDPTNGYAIASPSTVSLPSGISIGSDTICKMFVHRGVVRITGPTDGTKGVPLWYGYVARLLFTDAWKQVYLGTFTSGTEGWTGNNANLSQYNCDTDPDSAGMWGAPQGMYALKVEQTGAQGSAKKSFTVTSSKRIRVIAMAFRKSGGAGVMHVKLGKTDGGNEYGIAGTSIEDKWVKLESTVFYATGTTLYAELVPGSGSSGIAYFDFIFIEEDAEVLKGGWKLTKAELEEQTVYGGMASLFDVDKDATDYAVLAKAVSVYDESQYSMPADISKIGDGFAGFPNELTILYLIGQHYSTNIQIGCRIPLLMNQIPDRLTGIALAVGTVAAPDFFRKPEEIPYYVAEELSLIDPLDSIRYIRVGFYYRTTEPNRIWLSYSGETPGYGSKDLMLLYGHRVKFANSVGSIDTIITAGGFDLMLGMYIEIAHPVYGGAGSVSEGLIDANTNQLIPDAGVEVERKWTYSDTQGYTAYICCNIENLPAAEMYDFIDIPPGSSDNAPDYDQHVVANDRAFVLSNEDGEEDVIRYSPINQPDSFPNLNIESITSGDHDRAKWIGERDGRLIVLKRRKLAQIHFSGDSFFSDIQLPTDGLYTGVRGAISENGIIYFMDQDDLKMFDGNRIVSLMFNEKMRKYYRENVVEGSFLLWDKLNRELQVHLSSSAILVWHPEMKEWYRRGTALTLLGGFIDAQNRLVVYTSGSFYTQNHSSSTGSESIDFEINTLLLDGANPERFKSLELLSVQLQANGQITVTVKDPNESRTFTQDITPAVMTDPIGVVECAPLYLFKEVSITVKNKTASATLTGKIKRISAEVSAWN